MNRLENLPKISRKAVATVHRCPACGTHLRRLGTWKPKGLGNDDPRANLIIEGHYACQHHKCDRKVLRKIDRDGIPAFEVHPDPHPDAVKKATMLMGLHEERTAEPVDIKIIKLKTLEPGEGDAL